MRGKPAPNAYSRRWFATFLGHIDAGIVVREVAFLERQLPSPPARLLDLCCGPGRHVGPLTASGYRVIGLDRDAESLGAARAATPLATVVCADMLLVPLAGASVDAVICMWQSFGYLDAQTNRSALVEMRRVLRPGGTLVLDLYHREFYASTEGNRIIERDGRRIHEQRAMAGNRLHVRLRYDNPDELDEFEWLLYTPTELAGVARSIGLDHVLTCTEFDERIEASAEHPRMQLVFEAQ